MSANRASRARKKRPPPDLDVHVLDTVDRLRALADPLRIKFLMELAKQPATVKEVAEELGVPPTRLYYHLKILERHGLVRVANRRMVSGIEERTYEAVAENWSVPPSMAAAAIYETGALGALFDVVRAEIEVVLQGSPDVPVEDPGAPLKAMAITEFELSPDEVEEALRLFGEFLDRYAVLPERTPQKNKERYNMFYALYRTPTASSANEKSD